MVSRIKTGISLGVLLVVAMAARWWGTHSSDTRPEETGLLGEPLLTPPTGLENAAAGAGLLLLGAWFLGILLKSLGLPRITGFLLFGLAVGPSAGGLISKIELDYLRLVNDLAIALIALTAGGEIKISFVKRYARVILSVLSLQTLLVMLLTGTGAWFMVRALDESGVLGGTSEVLLALVLASIGVASSPAVAIALITELGARGPLAQTVLAVTVCKDFILVVLFSILIAMASASIGGGESGGDPPPEGGSPPAAAEAAEGDAANGADEADAGESSGSEPPVVAEGGGSLPLYLLQHLGGAILLGAVVGIGLAWYVQVVGGALPIVMTLTCFGIALVSERLHFEPLLVALTAGMLMENVWQARSAAIFETLERLSLPVYCVFFAVAGSKMDLGVLAASWGWTLVFLGTRAVSVIGGTWLGAVAAGSDATTRRWLWSGFVSQAGVAVALAHVVDRTFGDLGFSDALFNVLIVSIALNELVGPLMLKVGLVRAGETAAQTAGPSRR